MDPQKDHIHIQLTSNSISPTARADGVYKKHAYPFCLPVEHTAENLMPEIRAEAIAWFAERGIHWHDGAGENLWWVRTHPTGGKVSGGIH